MLLLRQRLLTECDCVKHYFDRVIDFSARFRRLRDTLQLSQEQMATRLHISANYLSQIENGREPSVRVIEALRRLEEDSQKAPGFDSGAVTGSHSGRVEEPPSGFGIRSLPPATEAELECQAIFSRLLAVTGGDVDRVIWLREQLRAIAPPRHWITEDKWDAQIDRLFEEMRSGRAAKGAREQGA